MTPAAGQAAERLPEGDAPAPPGRATLELLVAGGSLSAVERHVATLRDAGLAVHGRQVGSPGEVLEAVGDGATALLLIHCDAPAVAWRAWCAEIREAAPDLGVLLLSETPEALLTAAVSAGALELLHPEEPRRLALVVGREFRNLQLRTAQRRLERRLGELEVHCRLLFEGATEAIAIVHEGMHVHANAAYLGLFGLDDGAELEGLPLMDLVAAEERPRLKAALRDLGPGGQGTRLSLALAPPAGTGQETELELSGLSLGDEPCIQVVIRTPSPRRPPGPAPLGRDAFLEHLGQRLAGHDPEAAPLGLLHLTITNIAALRAELGSAASRGVTEALARLLAGRCTQEESLAPLAEHEFLLLTAGERAEARARELLAAVDAHPFAAGPHPPRLECRIGVARSDTPGVTDAHALLDLVFRASAAAGPDPVCLHRPAPGPPPAPADQEDRFSALVQCALEGGGLCLHYQPILSLGEVDRHDHAVLVRLEAGGREWTAEEFLPAIEASGRMAEIDRWVIRHALEELVRQHRAGRALNLFVSLSPASLGEPALLPWLGDQLRETGAEGGWLTLQLGEDAVRGDLPAARRAMQGLAALGCRIALHHFGGGPGGERLLGHLPLALVKLAPALTRGLARDRRRQAELRELNARIEAAGAACVAMGVEDAGTLAALWGAGIAYAQGHFIQEPLAEIVPEGEP